MKANAPKKLYVDVCDNLSDSILYGFTQKRTDKDIEYTRTDAFIEKAVKWISNNCYIPHATLEDFKNYMKGE